MHLVIQADKYKFTEERLIIGGLIGELAKSYDKKITLSIETESIDRKRYGVKIIQMKDIREISCIEPNIAEIISSGSMYIYVIFSNTISRNTFITSSFNDI